MGWRVAPQMKKTFGEPFITAGKQVFPWLGAPVANIEINR